MVLLYIAKLLRPLGATTALVKGEGGKGGGGNKEADQQNRF